MDRACNGKLTRTFTVTQEKHATSVGSGSVEVLATPMVAAMMENTAAGSGPAGAGRSRGDGLHHSGALPFP